jgi:phospho-N-acetylmuramoyl-pentapeptide-transferase
MLLWLTHFLAHYVHGFRVFQYLTFRTITATLTSLLIALLFSPVFIKRLRLRQIGQSVREDGPQSHLKKSGTPTMGGLIILFSIVLSTLLWGNLESRYLWGVVVTVLVFGGVGFWDDYKKVVLRSSDGISARMKISLQVIFALCVTLYLYFFHAPGESFALQVPFVKSWMIDLGPWFILVAVLVIVGSSNAVNLTDGLDGLAIMPIVLVALALGVFSYCSGNVNFSHYLNIQYITGVGELAVFCGSIVGAGLGFLWYNAYPAQIFMGDVGSLSLGATLGVLAVMVRQELLLFLMGGIFVAETVSVILQVGSYKLRKKRIFRMAPLHHHFELKGWSEPKIIVRFWIITVILVLIGLSSLKLH